MSNTKEQRKLIIKTLKSFGLKMAKTRNVEKEVTYNNIQTRTKTLEGGYKISKDSSHIEIIFKNTGDIIGSWDMTDINEYENSLTTKISDKLKSLGFDSDSFGNDISIR